MAYVKDGCAYIPLQKSPGRKRLFAIVDEEDFERVSKHSWHAAWSGRTFYVRASSTALLASHHQRLHSFIMKAERGVRVDHVDGNGLNNRRSNLRPATVSQNAANSFKQTGTHTASKFKGVIHTSSGKWGAAITVEGHRKVIALFEKEEEAARAYDKAAIDAFGEFAKTNAMMGLFDNDEIQRDRLGWRIEDYSELGANFVSNKHVVKPEVVVALRWHRRKRGKILYKLNTGRTVPPENFEGSHPSADELEEMKRHLFPARVRAGNSDATPLEFHGKFR